MKKLIVLVTMVVVFAMTGMTSMAATPRQYEDYQIVKTGIEGDIAELEEDEDVIVYSVETKEFPTERTCVITARVINIDDGANYRLFYYLNGESEEVIAVVYNSDGDVVEQNVMNMTDAADLYR